MAEWLESLKSFVFNNDDKPEHFHAIGRLVSAFNGIDAALNQVMREYLRTPGDAIARAVIGEMRTGDLLAALKRVARARRTDDAELDIIENLVKEISQLKIIRDDVAHRVFGTKERQMAFTNAWTTKNVDSTEVSFYSIDELHDFARYAYRLRTRVFRLVHKIDDQAKPHNWSMDEWRAAERTLYDIPARLRTRGRAQKREAARSGRPPPPSSRV